MWCLRNGLTQVTRSSESSAMYFWSKKMESWPLGVLVALNGNSVSQDGDDFVIFLVTLLNSIYALLVISCLFIFGLEDSLLIVSYNFCRKVTKEYVMCLHFPKS